jgi:hypothetical protein
MMIKSSNFCAVLQSESGVTDEWSAFADDCVACQKLNPLTGGAENFLPHIPASTI